VAGSALHLDEATIDHLFRQANAERWALPRDVFARALHTSAERAFAGRQPARREMDRYLSAVHVADLALACACALGHEGAWDYFVHEHRPLLYRTADALAPGGGARELADALYADLYGLHETEGERRSLFRYFHGRSSLATWLRAVLSQRYVDQVRRWRRTQALPDDSEPAADPVPPPDPDRPRLGTLVQEALTAAIARLPAKDRLRLRSYYVVELTLAQIGRLTGEHEATVSRQLARARRLLRDEVTRDLRDAGLDRAEIERGLELVLEDPGGLDVQALMGSTGRKNE
jgi:RNA polymerase sigma-70 factor (ECF subfamily)